jgi:ComEC/Rec2-related protein
MVGLSVKIIFASVKASIDSRFPGLRRWLRMPGILSLAAVTAGTLLAFALPFRTGEPLLHGATVAVLAAFAGAGILMRPPVARFFAFLLFAFLLCLMRRAHQSEVFSFARVPSGTPERTAFVGRVASAPLPAYENFHFLLKIDSTGDALMRPLVGKTVNCVSPVEPPIYGTVAVRGFFSPPAPRRNPFEHDEFASMMARGVWGSFAADECRTLLLRRTLPERCAASFRGVTCAALGKISDYDNRALLQAVFLGDTEFLSPFIKDIFRKSGIYHLIAISGLNTAILVGVLYFFLGLFPLPRTVVHLACILALWAYLPFVGMIPSLFRATVMATCVIAAVFFEKKNYAMHTLGLAGTLWLVISPESLFEPGFQLSFAATAGILALYPVFSRFTPKPDNRFLQPVIAFLFSSFYISLVSFLATAPVLLYHFGTVSYFGLLANLVAVAAMTVSEWLFFAGLLCQMAVPLCAAIPLWIAERFLDIIVWTGKLAGHFSWSQMTYPAPPPEIAVLSAVFLVGLATVKQGRMKPFLIAGMLAAALVVPASLLARRLPQRLEAVRFAVPKGQLLGVRWPDRRVWVIAPRPNRSLPYLLERRVLPWIRHRAGRIRPDALVVPDDFRAMADTLFEKNFRAAPERLVIVPVADSFMSIFTPGRRCTCAIGRGGADVRVRIAAPFFDTTLFLAENGAGGRRKPSDQEIPRARSAVIMTAGGKCIRSRAVVRPDHPVW